MIPHRFTKNSVQYQPAGRHADAAAARKTRSGCTQHPEDNDTPGSQSRARSTQARRRSSREGSHADSSKRKRRRRRCAERARDGRCGVLSAQRECALWAGEMQSCEQRTARRVGLPRPIGAPWNKSKRSTCRLSLRERKAVQSELISGSTCSPKIRTCSPRLGNSSSSIPAQALNVNGSVNDTSA